MIIFLPWNVVKEKLILAGRGGISNPGLLKMSPLAFESLFDFRATLVGRYSSNAHGKPNARRRGASVKRMEFNATPVAIRIGAVTIMTMISFKQSIALDMYFHFHQ